MPTTPAATIPALDALRRPIRDYTPEDPAGRSFRAAMLGLADELEEMESDDGTALESEVVWAALHAFPILVAPGPSPSEMLEIVLAGHCSDAEAADTLHTLGSVRRALEAFEPPGFAAALLRAMLRAIYDLIGISVVFDDQRAINQCLNLLDTAEGMADRLAGRV